MNSSDVAEKLDTLIKLQAISAMRDIETKKEKILLLAACGLPNALIAKLTDSTPKSVSQTVYAAKKSEAENGE